MLRAGRPAVNPWLQTGLAWDLDVPLSGVQPTWNSTLRHPHWDPPAMLFRGPAHYGGPPPHLSPNRPVERVARTRDWTVLRASG